jgi:hypothetical protein
MSSVPKRLREVKQLELRHWREREALESAQRNELLFTYRRCLPVGTRVKLLRAEHGSRAGTVFVTVGDVFLMIGGDGAVPAKKVDRVGRPNGGMWTLSVAEFFYPELWRVL